MQQSVWFWNDLLLDTFKRRNYLKLIPNYYQPKQHFKQMTHTESIFFAKPSRSVALFGACTWMNYIITWEAVVDSNDHRYKWHPLDLLRVRSFGHIETWFGDCYVFFSRMVCIRRGPWPRPKAPCRFPRTQGMGRTLPCTRESFLSNFQRNIVSCCGLWACTHHGIQICRPFRDLVWEQQPSHFQELQAVPYIWL